MSAMHNPGPWEATPNRIRSNASRPFWNVTRYNPTKLGHVEYVKTPANDLRRWYDRAMAEKVAAELNAAEGRTA